MTAPTARELLDKINSYDGATGASLYELASRVEKVLALHKQVESHSGREMLCKECSDLACLYIPWPCPTVRTLNGEEA